MLQGENGPGAAIGRAGSEGTVAAGRQHRCKIGSLSKC